MKYEDVKLDQIEVTISFGPGNPARMSIDEWVEDLLRNGQSSDGLVRYNKDRLRKALHSLLIGTYLEGHGAAAQSMDPR